MSEKRAPDQQRSTVRVAAINAISAICVAAIRRGAPPPAPILENLSLLRMIASDNSSTSLDEYLRRKFGRDEQHLAADADDAPPHHDS